MKKFFNEFKEFAIKGNMIDLAIGLMISTAFTAVVKSIVDDLVMPLIGIIIGGKDFSGLSIMVGSAQIKYGMFIQNMVNFLIIALCLFIVVKAINTLKRKKVEEEVAEEPAPEKPADIALLEEILAELKKKQ